METRVRRTSFGRALFELFSSMRFAVSLLVILAIASIIGTVLKQNQPYPDYIFEFGDFWFPPFEWLGLFDVYHASWFLLILAFLVTSTSLCIYRQFPGVMRDWHSFREAAAIKSLRAMSHQQSFALAGEHRVAIDRSLSWLQSQGYRAKQVTRSDGVLLAAKKGSLQRMGYLFTHAAIVVICIGGLLDGNLPFKIQTLLNIKQIETRNLPASQVPPLSRLSAANLSYRGNIDLPEGSSGDVVFVPTGRGYFVQELPFTIKLKQFHIEHYSTGQPKLFASDIEVRNKSTSKVTTGTVQVNHPLIVDGVAIYQSSFGDGGSKLNFAAWDLRSTTAAPQPLNATSQTSQAINWGNTPLTLELGDFRPFNIENIGETAAASGMGRILQDARQVKAQKQVKNLGPSIQFKVRDAQAQAHEYLNYLAPFEDEGRYYLMSGVRSQVAAPFAFVRIPLDGEMKPDSFMRLRALLSDPKTWPEIARRTAAKAGAAGAISDNFHKEFEQSLNWVLQRFAEGGFPALEKFLSDKVPQDKRSTVAQTYIKLLQGASVEAWSLMQERAGQQPSVLDEAHYRFLMDSLVAISASFDYGTGFYLQPIGFTEVKSSGFQLSRSPGQPLVYLGSLLLVIGIFCMFYIRENRIWLWISGSELLLAMSSNRHDAITQREFANHQTAFASITDTTTESTP